ALFNHKTRLMLTQSMKQIGFSQVTEGQQLTLSAIVKDQIDWINNGFWGHKLGLGQLENWLYNRGSLRKDFSSIISLLSILFSVE
ncbi:hypothetical protein XELAEV_18002686mg, partial [Xenopus laevis]